MEEPGEFLYVSDRSFLLPCVSRPVSVHCRGSDLKRIGGGPGDQVGNLPPKVGAGRAWLRARAARVPFFLTWVSIKEKSTLRQTKALLRFPRHFLKIFYLMQRIATKWCRIKREQIFRDLVAVHEAPLHFCSGLDICVCFSNCLLRRTQGDGRDIPAIYHLKDC